MCTVVLQCACADGSIGEPRTPELRGATAITIDSVDLAETDSIFISKPQDILIRTSGNLLVADVGLRRIVEFGTGGEIVRTLGRPGSGPGEFSAPGWMAVNGDSTVLVENGGVFRIEAFDLVSGEWRWGRRLDARTSTGLAAWRDSVAVAFPDASGATTYLVFKDTTGATEARGQLPQTAFADPIIADAFRLSQVAVRAHRIAQFFEFSDWISSVPTLRKVRSISS